MGILNNKSLFKKNIKIQIYRYIGFIIYSYIIMKQNESWNDRIVRVILGVLFIILARYAFQGGLSVLFYILWIAGLITGVIWYCYLYKLLGINTCKLPKK